MDRILAPSCCQNPLVSLQVQKTRQKRGTLASEPSQRFLPACHPSQIHLWGSQTLPLPAWGPSFRLEQPV